MYHWHTTPRKERSWKRRHYTYDDGNVVFHIDDYKQTMTIKIEDQIHYLNYDGDFKRTKHVFTNDGQDWTIKFGDDIESPTIHVSHERHYSEEQCVYTQNQSWFDSFQEESQARFDDFMHELFGNDYNCKKSSAADMEIVAPETTNTDLTMEVEATKIDSSKTNTITDPIETNSKLSNIKADPTTKTDMSLVENESYPTKVDPSSNRSYLLFVLSDVSPRELDKIVAEANEFGEDSIVIGFFAKKLQTDQSSHIAQNSNSIDVFQLKIQAKYHKIDASFVKKVSGVEKMQSSCSTYPSNSIEVMTSKIQAECIKVGTLQVFAIMSNPGSNGIDPWWNDASQDYCTRCEAIT